jgi:hypothetical protein
LQLLVVVMVCSLSALVHAGVVEMGGFQMSYGLTGCLSTPTRNCVNGKDGDTCYVDRGLGFAISGTTPVCNACMPYNHRNIAMYQDPQHLPCALWHYYGCDDLFVTHVWYKSGSNGCLSGNKSYNMKNQFTDAATSEQAFIETCRQEKTKADYGWPPSMKMISEEEFCSPLRNNITMVDPTNKSLPSYKEYFEKKYMKN